MAQGNSIDLGSIQVHKSVIEEIIDAAIRDMEGVSLVEEKLSGTIFRLLGKKKYPGISIKTLDEGQLSVEVKVIVRYGLNIPETARQIQDTIKMSLDKTVDLDLKNINVNIHGIERGRR
ncbi:MAG: Asp23/Gls24 family envelope stress response protein [Candidatus Omnitrophica bacterium]|nr:Asp23/Gls24 family envelope stress response protein [Candidatus Omnitrophota bacterium]MBU1997043.1 Asp23/Gls24 family envelope stress response protein [Candidatus Omnitrophota bacterium]MBU4334570.1 Asp23/Gls24 family envelope stress response protein [Candidatus Omnitrophota bacterium]